MEGSETLGSLNGWTALAQPSLSEQKTTDGGSTDWAEGRVGVAGMTVVFATGQDIIRGSWFVYVNRVRILVTATSMLTLAKGNNNTSSPVCFSCEKAFSTTPAVPVRTLQRPLFYLSCLCDGPEAKACPGALSLRVICCLSCPDLPVSPCFLHLA